MRCRNYLLSLVLLLAAGSVRAQQADSVIVDTTTTKWKVVVPVKEGEWHGLAKYYHKKTDTLVAEIVYVKGKKNGLALGYDAKTGCKEGQGMYKDDARVGDWVFIEDCAGTPGKRVHYEPNSDSGYVTVYYPSGNLFREGVMKKDEMDGIWKQYFDAPGKLEMISNKCFSKDNGDAAVYDSLTQNIVARGAYKCGTKTGTWSYFDPYRKILMGDENYNDSGELHGFTVVYFPDGKKESEARFVDGRRSGITRYYDHATQSVIQTEYYTNDTLEGKMQEFYPGGKLKREGTYKAGVPYGFWKGYYENGALEHVGEYEGTTGFAQVKFYAPNGKLQQKGRSKDNLKYGVWEFYDEAGSGDLLDVSEYKDDILHGKASRYYPSGKLKWKGEHESGMVHGKWKRYYPSGELWVVAEYDHGKFVNELRTYYESGKLRRKEKYDKGTLLNSVCYDENGKEIAYSPVFNPPAFDGLQEYFKANLVYPQEAMDKRLEGEVAINVFIDEDGSVSQIDIWKGLCQLCDIEAARLITEMPNWKPATLDGFPIGEEHCIKVPFRLK